MTTPSSTSTKKMQQISISNWNPLASIFSRMPHLCHQLYYKILQGYWYFHTRLSEEYLRCQLRTTLTSNAQDNAVVTTHDHHHDCYDAIVSMMVHYMCVHYGLRQYYSYSRCINIEIVNKISIIREIISTHI